MMNSTKFTSTGVASILKSYLGLTDSDVLKEKTSYPLTYEHVMDDEQGRCKLALNPRISLFRYLCEVLEAPCLTLQTMLDSYVKTREVKRQRTQGYAPDPYSRTQAVVTNNSGEEQPYGLEFLTYVRENALFGAEMRILDEWLFRWPNPTLNVEYMRKGVNNVNRFPSFDHVIFSISNTSTYVTDSRIGGIGCCDVHGPGGNSPLSDHDGIYVLMMFTHSLVRASNSSYGSTIRLGNINQEHRGLAESDRRPFYSNHVCFRLKKKHTDYQSDVDGEPNRMYFGGDGQIGTNLVDIYACTPWDYDKCVNGQGELVVRTLRGTRNLMGVKPCLSLRHGGPLNWDFKRNTLIRWSARTGTANQFPLRESNIEWRFSGRHYRAGEKFRLNNNEIPNLESCEITRDEKYLGKGKIYADADGMLYCPLTGYPLRCCARVNETYKNMHTV